MTPHLDIVSGGNTCFLHFGNCSISLWKQHDFKLSECSFCGRIRVGVLGHILGPVRRAVIRSLARFSALDQHGFRGVVHVTFLDYGAGEGVGGPLKGARSRGGVPGRFQSESLWRPALARSESFLPRRAQLELAPSAVIGGGCGGPSPGPPGLSPISGPVSLPHLLVLRELRLLSLRCDPRGGDPKGRRPMC
nr:uncharacterized protein LOC105724298 [Aotus nancymaae]